MQKILLICLIALAYTQTPCADTSIFYFNSNLQAGLLPTNLFQQAMTQGVQYIPFVNTQTGTVSGQAYTITSKNFAVEVNSQKLQFAGAITTAPSGTITASNPLINIYVYFTISYGGVNQAQGVATISNFSQFTYTFNVNIIPASDDDEGDQIEQSYSLSYSAVTFNIATTPFTSVYINFPYTTNEQATILSNLNKGFPFQAALNTYYTTGPGSLSTQLTTLINKFPIVPIGGSAYQVSYTYEDDESSWTFPFTYTTQLAEFQFAPTVGYFLAIVANVNGLTTPYQCGYSLTIPAKIPSGQIQQISLEFLQNTFQYALQAKFLSSQLSYQYWNIPYFSWITAGLNGIINSAYLGFPYTTQISGSCNVQTGTVSYYTTQQLNFQMTYLCTINAGTAQIGTLNVQFTSLYVGLVLTSGSTDIYLQVSTTQAANNYVSTYTPTGTYTVQNQALLNYYFTQAITTQVYGSQYLMGSLNVVFNNPTYTINTNYIQVQEV
ncbi:hypothetical protein pb186bvf_019574 [Paramecium bursaria]